MLTGGLITAGAVLSAGGGLAKIIGGDKAYKEAKAEQEALKRPFYDIQDEYTQNRNILANRAEQGLGSAAKDFATTQLEQGVGAGISAVQQAGGDPNVIAQILQGYNQSVNELAAQDAMMQTQNIGRFIEANKDLAGQKTIQQQINEFNPYYDKMAYTSQQMNIAKQNKTQGWNDFLGSISAAATAMSNDELQKAQIGALNRSGQPANMPTAAPTLNTMPTSAAPLLYPIQRQTSPPAYQPNVPLNPQQAANNPYGANQYPILDYGNTTIDPLTLWTK